MTQTYGNYIDGEWSEATTGETFENRSPSNTDELIGRYQRSSEEDAVAAVEAAAAAADEWADMPAPERGRILERTSRLLADRKDELTETLSREEGKTLDEASGEVQRAVDIFQYYAAKARDLGGTVKSPSSPDQNLYTVKEPLGVAALITPWNYPIAIPAWKIAPALATGNTVVFKPASLTPEIARNLVECLNEAGLPDGVLNYVTGSGSEVGGVFTTHEDVDAVSFTGSAKVGDHVYQSATGDQKRVQLEMGSKNPAVVMPSADLDEAVDIVAAGAFGVTGQACTATSRALVHESVYDEFVDRIVDRAEEIEIGPGMENPDMGPHASRDELESTLEYVSLGSDEGATLLTGGERFSGDGLDDGHYVEPAVFADVEPEMRIAREEIFGPVLSVIPISSLDDAIEVANDVDFGLSASIVTDDLREANRFVEEAEVGVAKVNEKTTGLELHVPFGGVKGSSSETFREQGDAAIDFYTLPKTVYMSY
ncbi:2,5-dioxovalerate dehydrogenase [Halorussus salinisoli]|uniref:2,5-dioxovalerate dehydrogenase n=1 Tax=Halorussus salinisoli TaxID=2558242 RepID=UPI0010C18844|nr:aldehyde dehydrogenase family protein [Halorussus salinisoli]